jgi:hypothetical protein
MVVSTDDMGQIKVNIYIKDLGSKITCMHINYSTWC